MNKLSTTDYDETRILECKSWCRKLFLYVEIQAWQVESLIKNYTPH